MEILGNYCRKCGAKERTNFFSTFFLGYITIYNCTDCNIPLCQSCINTLFFDKLNVEQYGLVDTRYDGANFCDKCYKKHDPDVDSLIKKWNDAYNLRDDVDVVSSNYQGKKQVKGEQLKISTRYYRDKNKALSRLKTKARYLGYDIVIDVELHKDKDWEETDSGGEFYYSIWSYSGIATHKK